MQNLKKCSLKGLLITAGVLSVGWLSPPAWAIECDDTAQVTEKLEVIAQHINAISNRSDIRPTYQLSEIAEYQTLQACSEEIIPALVELIAAADHSNRRLMHALWFDLPDISVTPLLDAFNQAENVSAQENLIETIASIIHTNAVNPRLNHQLQSPALNESMLSALYHSSSEVRVSAVTALANLADPEFVTPITTAIRNEPLPPPVSSSPQQPTASISPRAYMAQVLAYSPIAFIAVPEILDLIQTAPDWDVYANLLPALDHLVSEEDPNFERTINLLANMVLNDTRQAAAFNAVIQLGQFGAAAQPVIPQLVEAMQKSDLDSSTIGQLPRTLVQIGEDLVENIDSVNQAEIEELISLYETALQHLSRLDDNNQEEQAALKNIVEIFQQFAD